MATPIAPNLAQVSKFERKREFVRGSWAVQVVKSTPIASRPVRGQPFPRKV